MLNARRVITFLPLFSINNWLMNHREQQLREQDIRNNVRVMLVTSTSLSNYNFHQTAAIASRQQGIQVAPMLPGENTKIDKETA